MCTRTHIAVFENDPGVRDLIAENLRLAGYDVSAGSQTDIAANLAARPADLIVLDLGYTDAIARSLLREVGQQAAPILATTTQPDLLGGMNGSKPPILLKPFTLGALLQSVERLVASQ